MRAVTHRIGNSDDKLTQSEWAALYAAIDTAVKYFAKRMHLTGTPPSNVEIQNAFRVFAIDDDVELRSAVKRIRSEYRQESAAWSEGPTEFL